MFSHISGDETVVFGLTSKDAELWALIFGLLAVFGGIFMSCAWYCGTATQSGQQSPSYSAAEVDEESPEVGLSNPRSDAEFEVVHPSLGNQSIVSLGDMSYNSITSKHSTGSRSSRSPIHTNGNSSSFRSPSRGRSLTRKLSNSPDRADKSSSSPPRKHSNSPNRMDKPSTGAPKKPSSSPDRTEKQSSDTQRKLAQEASKPRNRSPQRKNSNSPSKPHSRSPSPSRSPGKHIASNAHSKPPLKSRSPPKSRPQPKSKTSSSSS
mmetsp:Transcript_10827/g.16482  ORF Transcript_10827/g.16482 Transcript_10827/m.16482 type:complete len:264 (-) Transcript_10827:184-975(-)